MTKRSLDQLLKTIQQTNICQIKNNREIILCQCKSIDDQAFPDITITIGGGKEKVSLIYESKYYL